MVFLKRICLLVIMFSSLQVSAQDSIEWEGFPEDVYLSPERTEIKTFDISSRKIVLAQGELDGNPVFYIIAKNNNGDIEKYWEFPTDAFQQPGRVESLSTDSEIANGQLKLLFQTYTLDPSTGDQSSPLSYVRTIEVSEFDKIDSSGADEEVVIQTTQEEGN